MYRGIECMTWGDPWFESLSREAAFLFIYFISNPRTTASGCYEISRKRIIFEAKLRDRAELDTLLDELSHSLTWFEAENYVFVHNFVTYQGKSQDYKLGAARHANKTPDVVRTAFFARHTDLLEMLGEKDRDRPPTVPPPSPHRPPTVPPPTGECVFEKGEGHCAGADARNAQGARASEQQQNRTETERQQQDAPAPAREGRRSKADGLAPVGSLLAAANLSLRSPGQETEQDAGKLPAHSRPPTPAAAPPPEARALADRVHKELGVNAELAAQLAKLKPERCQAWLDAKKYVKLDDKGNPGGFFRVAIADDGYALPKAYLDAQAAQAKKSERADKAAAAREQQASADAERDRLDAAFAAMPEPDRVALIAQAEQEVRSVSTLAGVLGGKRPAGWDRLVAGARRSIQAEREKPP